MEIHIHLQKTGEYEFKFVGPAGNAGVAKAVVNWIDKLTPEPLLIYSTILPTNNNVTAAVVFENEPEGEVTITNNDGKNSYEFDENGNFTFEFSDRAGNTGRVTATVNNIDRIAPTGAVSYNLTELTNRNVVATLENMSEEVRITNNDGNSSYTFTENGSFTFEFVDRAGNAGSATAQVTWIDKILPIAEITYSTTEPTNQNVVATIEFNKENVIVEGGNQHTFTENGEYTFEYVDQAGNAGMATASVSWIDKVKPSASIRYSTNIETKESVIATLVDESEEITITNNNGSRDFTFIENGEFTFEFVDKVGNRGTATAKVTWIDKIPLTAKIEYNITGLTNKDVVATISFNKKDVTVTGGNTHTFTENGEFTFEFVDKVGNRGTATAKVTWIDKIPPTAKIEYNITELTNKDVVATISFNKKDVTVTGGSTHTFTENGEFTFEYVDKAGNKGTAIAKVTWIDKIPPTAKIKYSIENPTKDNVIATIAFDEEGVTVAGGNTHTFTENGEYTFEYVDKAGNKGTATAKVTWIDKNIDEEFIFNLEKYKIEDGCILNIEPKLDYNMGTTVEAFKKNINTNRSITILNAKGEALTDNSLITTGCKLRVGTSIEYTLIVAGDTDGDGKLTINDVAQVKLHIIELEELTGIRFKAGDIDNNKDIEINDVAQVKLKIIGLFDIK